MSVDGANKELSAEEVAVELNQQLQELGVVLEEIRKEKLERAEKPETNARKNEILVSIKNKIQHIIEKKRTFSRRC